jgi:hypothetical protein
MCSVRWDCFEVCISSETSQGRLFPGGLPTMVASGTWTLASTRRSWSVTDTDYAVWTGFLSHPRSHWLHRSNVRSTGLQMVLSVHALSPWTSQQDIGLELRTHSLKSLLLTVQVPFFRAILHMNLVTQFTAVLHAGCSVLCHSFQNVWLCFKRWPTPNRSQFHLEAQFF